MAEAARLSLLGPRVMRSFGARMTGIDDVDDRGSIVCCVIVEDVIYLWGVSLDGGCFVDARLLCVSWLSSSWLLFLLLSIFLLPSLHRSIVRKASLCFASCRIGITLHYTLS